MMKKIVLMISVALLSFLLLISIEVNVVSGSLTGPESVRAGDMITLSFNISGSNIYGASGTLSYDSSQVTLLETSQKIDSPWIVKFNDDKFDAYDYNLNSPINGNKTVFTVTFKVKSVETGTNIKISYTDVKTPDGSANANVGTITYSATVVTPLSVDNDFGNKYAPNVARED